MKSKGCIKNQKEKILLGMILLIGVVVGTTVFLRDMEKRQLEQGHILTRPAPGEGEREEVLQIDTPYGTEVLYIQVKEKKLRGAEIQEKLQEFADGLPVRILGENKSLEEVYFPLNLIQELEDFPVYLEWSVQEDGFVHRDGSLKQENLPEKGAVTKLTAQLTWEEQVLIRDLYVRVFPEKKTEQEIYLESLRDKIEKTELESQYLDAQILPASAEGFLLNWRRTMDFRGIYIGLLFVAAAILFVLSGRSREKQFLHKKRIQMEMDYPEVVSKLKLYMETGLTCRSAWMKILEDYQRKQRTEQILPRAIYEEMVKAGYEMQSGVSELRAYERFGERCGVSCCKRLTGLLIQNMRKGNSGLGQLLETEVWQAFEARKMLAKKQGEEAGTKLLLPMMGMLGIVMTIVIAPAFISMQM